MPRPRGLPPGTEVTKLVYIGGYGHSGSTLLEYLLAASPKVVACGEVASVLRERRRKANAPAAARSGFARYGVRCLPQPKRSTA
jgi:hypothetical protein